MGRSLLIVALFLTTCLAPAQTPVAEQYLLSAINQERTARSLPPLHTDAALHTAAWAHAQQMAAHGTISHQFAGEAELATRGSSAGARFARITENVAEGPDVLVLHDAWMHSPGHRANILDPAVDAVGIAVLKQGRQLFVVEDFEHVVERLTLDAQENAVAILLDRAGLDLVPDAAARDTCGRASGYAGDRQPTFVFRYTTGNLSHLPPQLEKRLATRKEHEASVGACTNHNASTFASYNIAVMLYP